MLHCIYLFMYDLVRPDNAFMNHEYRESFIIRDDSKCLNCSKSRYIVIVYILYNTW